MNIYGVIALGITLGIATGYAILVFWLWFYGHGGDYDTPYKRGRDGWRYRH